MAEAHHPYSPRPDRLQTYAKEPRQNGEQESFAVVSRIAVLGARKLDEDQTPGRLSGPPNGYHESRTLREKDGQ